MKVQFDIVRQKNRDSAPYHQIILFETDDENASVARALRLINADPQAKDLEGNPIEKIQWESSCLQKKCGACAMRINGCPKLACDTKLAEYPDGKILLEPLRKFPVIADLMVDRSVLYEHLSKMQIWLREATHADEVSSDVAYDASRCLQCGCCLEICPNFHAEGRFFGTAAMVPATRLLAELPKGENQTLASSYRRYIFEGCGKSLACRDICPAGIDMEKLLIHSNAIAVWKRSPQKVQRRISRRKR